MAKRRNAAVVKTANHLATFMLEEMRMQHVYQPLLIRTLIDAGGSATLRQLAVAFLARDERQIKGYERHIKTMPVDVLASHGVVSLQGDQVVLNAYPLTLREQAGLRRICEDKIHEYIQKNGLSTWDLQAPIASARSTTSVRSELAAKREPNCTFCSEEFHSRVKAANGSVFAVPDAHPVTPGHMLVVPYRHTEDFFSMTTEEQSDAEGLIRQLRARIQRSDPDVRGFNLGSNCGPVAGQTIMHAHIHLIPRREGDTPDPRGGIRGVIPSRMSY
ncbi:MAG: HIT family protein [Bacillota bacterium]